jgi:hypothetical protein
MDTEQIQQQMRERRAAIDTKLDQLSCAAATARRRSVPALLAMAASVAALMLWKRYRRGRTSVGRRRLHALDDQHVHWAAR